MKFKRCDYRLRGVISSVCSLWECVNEVNFFKTDEGVEGVVIEAGSIDDNTYVSRHEFIYETDLAKDTIKRVVECCEVVSRVYEEIKNEKGEKRK